MQCTIAFIVLFGTEGFFFAYRWVFLHFKVEDRREQGIGSESPREPPGGKVFSPPTPIKVGSWQWTPMWEILIISTLFPPVR